MIKKFIEKIESYDIFLLSYWIIYLLSFIYLENRVTQYHLMHSSIDDLIPFVPAFVIPYFLWFAYVFMILIYNFYTDKRLFRGHMHFIIIAYSFALIVCFIYPSYQNLRLHNLGDTGIFNLVINRLYVTDTPTNVFPSIHVIGAIGAMIFANKSEIVEKHLGLKIANVTLAVLICASTMFIKQHSAYDVAFGIIVALTVDFVINYSYIYQQNKFKATRVRN